MIHVQLRGPIVLLKHLSNTYSCPIDEVKFPLCEVGLYNYVSRNEVIKSMAPDLDCLHN